LDLGNPKCTLFTGTTTFDVIKNPLGSVWNIFEVTKKTNQTTTHKRIYDEKSRIYGSKPLKKHDIILHAG